MTEWDEIVTSLIGAEYADAVYKLRRVRYELDARYTPRDRERLIKEYHELCDRVGKLGGVLAVEHR